MYYKKGEIRPYLLGNMVYRGRIIKVEKDIGCYIVEDLITKERNTIEEEDIFLGDD